MALPIYIFNFWTSFNKHVGAGAYADNECGAVSTTGHGESITKVCLARQVTHLMESGTVCLLSNYSWALSSIMVTR